MAAGCLISFVMATYNRRAVVGECLEKVVEHCGLKEGEYEIRVVDNASTDQTAEMIAARGWRGVEVIRLERNCGPVAKSLALPGARGEFVVFLDDDAYPLAGAVGQMVEHFRRDAGLAAAVFDVRLPDGRQECSAYPDVFIGAGTGFPRAVLERVGGLPMEFFMQAEEYDLSFRILRTGGRIERFGDMPLLHLKTPGARIGERTTRLDVRNNLYLLARYLPAPLSYRLAADWLARYWMMAEGRDRREGESGHRKAFTAGAAEGLGRWGERHGEGRGVLPAGVVEQIFKLEETRRRMAAAQERWGFKRVLFADLGKNMLAYWEAARKAEVEVVAIADDGMAGATAQREYRGVPVVKWEVARSLEYEAIVVSNLSPVQAQSRVEALRRVEIVPVIDLFEGQAEGKG